MAFDDPRDPQTLERLNTAFAGYYRLERELGRGGMGTVYLAHDIKHGRAVAIKTLRPDSTSRSGAARFHREIRTTARLTHPHIVSLHDSGEIEGITYFVMEYIEGESLRHRLERVGPLSLDLAVRIVCDTAAALQHAHDRGFVHRDVKPENILLSAHDEVWITDFGVVSAVSEASITPITETGQVIGSPHYLSPEQVSSGQVLDGRSDEYSLACVFFEMLTSQPPFQASSYRSLIAQHLTKTPPTLRSLRAELSHNVESVVAKALSKDANNRFPTVGEFACALQAAARGERVSSLGTGPGRVWSMIRSTPTSRTRILALLAFAIVAATAPLWWERIAQRQDSPGAPTDYPANRLAVLFFEDDSPDSSLRHITSGLTYRLTHELGQVPALELVSPGTVKYFQEHGIPHDSLIRVFQAGSLVEGNVERLGEQLRIFVRLVDAGTGNLLTSASTVRPMRELTEAMDDVAASVAELLRRRLGPVVALQTRMTETDNAEALELVMTGDLAMADALELLQGQDVTQTAAALTLLVRADSNLARAAALDVDWAEPGILRGWTYVHRATLAEHDREAYYREAIRHADAALALNSGSAAAHELRGASFFRLAAAFLEDPANAAWLATAERELRAAVAKDRSLATAWSALSSVLRLEGRFAEAAGAAETALREDAYLADADDIIQILYRTSLNLDRENDAVRWCRQGRDRFPTDWRFLECELSLRAWTDAVQPDPKAAWALFNETEAIDPPAKAKAVDRPYSSSFRNMLVASVLARSGLPDSARAVMERTRGQLPATDGELQLDFIYDEACLRLMLGERDQAIRLLRGYLSARPEFRTFAKQDPRLRALRDDPRFTSLLSDS